MLLAEFNIGTLKYDWHDPRVADFADNLDRIYDIARRAPGYIWHMESEDMESAQLDAGGPLGGDAAARPIQGSIKNFRDQIEDRIASSRIAA